LQHTNGRSQSDDSMPAVLFFTVICCLGYLYWRQEILLTLTSISLFSIGLFIGSAIYAYIKDAIDGAGWTIYLIFSCGVAIFSFILIASALKPTYAPEGLDAFQTIFRRQKLTGLIKVLNIEALTWLITHIFGVLLLLYAQVHLSLSIGHYLAVVDLISAPNPRRLSIWFAARTDRYRNPMRNGIVLTISCFLSYILINGYGYVWYNRFFMHG
jgi:hypothetical protein